MVPLKHPEYVFLMQKNVYRRVTASYFLEKYFERYRQHFKMFWGREAHNFIADEYDGEVLFWATVLQISWQKRRKGERSQRHNFC